MDEALPGRTERNRGKLKTAPPPRHLPSPGLDPPPRVGRSWLGAEATGGSRPGLPTREGVGSGAAPGGLRLLLFTELLFRSLTAERREGLSGPPREGREAWGCTQTLPARVRPGSTGPQPPGRQARASGTSKAPGRLPGLKPRPGAPSRGAARAPLQPPLHTCTPGGTYSQTPSEPAGHSLSP